LGGELDHSTRLSDWSNVNPPVSNSVSALVNAALRPNLNDADDRYGWNRADCGR